MSGKDMFLGSAKEAASYGANVFMVYTGAPQNTRRKEVSELHISEGWSYMKEHGIGEIVIHAPYIINLANTIKPEIYELAVRFLTLERQRSAAMGSHTLILHPGAHVSAGLETGTHSIIQGLNEVLDAETPRDKDCLIALETMSGKGSEIGSRLEELAAIFDGVHKNDRLRLCLDTCHLHDAGYDVTHDFHGILTKIDRLFGLDKIAAVHVNDSKNPQGAAKDRHANIGDGYIGFRALHEIVHLPELSCVPKILETPWIPSVEDPDKKIAPYKEEISRLLKE